MDIQGAWWFRWWLEWRERLKLAEQNSPWRWDNEADTACKDPDSVEAKPNPFTEV